ncbi:ribosome maturation factor RimP [Candidatus Vondammii sp. HM_W22]|uniref:ribosome maturation factor RimP n=1 Tax=Candidatus Vondammii sp. HM_W22 TaxID=2687299 RepID=UPI002E7BC40E|nr:ribosome maturation factor RimP [Candidatus Vondammii sp. HM_W22]
MGYELAGVEYLSQRKGGSLLCIYIDHADGIAMGDCVKVSHQVSGVLDVEDPIHETYRLEVSSLGLDRPLFTKEDFDRFTGSRVNIKLCVKLQGRRRFEGFLNGTLDDDVLVTVDDENFILPLEQIDEARLVSEL